MRSILITGCSSGIGYDAAVTLRKRDWRVFAGCRKPEDVERLTREGFDAVHIDYRDTASIETGLSQVLDATGGTLDALFNNGAHGMLGAVEDLPTDALRDIFESNFFGWHELTRRVIPVMRAQGHGRIVQCASVLGFTVLRWRAAYNSTKHALEGYSDTLRIEMRDTPIHVSTIDPGPITTAFRKNSVAPFEKWVDWENSPRRNLYESKLIPRLYAPPGKPDPFELPPSAVTKKLIHALESRNPHPRYAVTTLTHIARFLVRVLPVRITDAIIARN